MASAPIRSFDEILGASDSSSSTESKDEAKDLHDDMKGTTDRKADKDATDEDKGKDATDGKGKDATDVSGPPGEKPADTGVPLSLRRLDPRAPVDPGPDEPVL